MLVIRRHPGESIQIGEEVEVLVIDCGNGRVKLGIRAPQHVQVMRSEVRHTREQNLAAAHAMGKPAGGNRNGTGLIPFLPAAVP